MRRKNSGVATQIGVIDAKVSNYVKLKLKDIGNTELVPSHGSVLACIYKDKGRVQIKKLYERIHKPKQTISEMIKRLVTLGYLEKEITENDKRSVFVVATKKTMDLKDDFRNISSELLELIYDGFTDEEVDELERLLNKVSQNLIDY